jgi:hypothetical protein
MFMEERQKDILKRVNETGRIQVAQIQELYNTVPEGIFASWRAADFSRGHMAGR